MLSGRLDLETERLESLGFALRVGVVEETSSELEIHTVVGNLGSDIRAVVGVLGTCKRSIFSVFLLLGLDIDGRLFSSSSAETVPVSSSLVVVISFTVGVKSGVFFSGRCNSSKHGDSETLHNCFKIKYLI